MEDDDTAAEPHEQHPPLPEHVLEPSPAQLSFNALSGQVVPETLRM